MTMKTGLKSFFVITLVMTCTWTNLSQTEKMDLRATGEHRIASSETVQFAEALATLTARHQLLKEAGKRLRDLPEIKAIPLKNDQVDALASTIVEVQTLHDDKADSSLYRVNAVAHLNPSLVALRLNQLRKDRNATAELADLWKQNEELYQQLTQPAPGNKDPKQMDLLITRITVNDIAAQVF